MNNFSQVADYSQLQADDSSVAYLCDQVVMLSRRSGELFRMGHLQEALTLTREAVSISRQLFNHNPAYYSYFLATSLCSLGEYSDKLGLTEEALAATKESVGLFRPLVRRNPEVFSIYLAIGLSNLSDQLARAGQKEEALRAAEEAAEIYQELTGGKGILLYMLAESLNRLGVRLAECAR